MQSTALLFEYLKGSYDLVRVFSTAVSPFWFEQLYSKQLLV